MSLQSNCWTLANGRNLEAGIELFNIPEKNQWELRLGPSGGFRALRLGAGNLHSYPFVKEGMLHDAEVSDYEGHTRLVRRGNWRGILVRITARNLHFSLPMLSANLKISAGGEGQRPIAYYGKSEDSLVRDQLFAVKDGTHILVIDRGCSIIRLGSRLGHPFAEAATKQDVLMFLSVYAKTAQTAPAQTWVLDQLRRLDSESREYREALALYPNLELPIRYAPSQMHAP